MLIKNLNYDDKEQVEKTIFLLKRLFKNINLTQWKWEYSNSPNKSHTTICEFNNKIIGHSAFIGLNFIFNGKIIKSSKFEGSLVDIKQIMKLKNKNDRKVFQKIIKHILEISNEKKTKFIFGFPSNQAIPSQVKAGFKVIDTKINNYTNIYNFYSLSKSNKFINYFFYLISLIMSFYVKFISKNYSEIIEYSGGHENELKNFSYKLSKINSNVLLTFFNEKYLTWKYIKNPISNHKVYLFFKNKKITGLLGFKIKDNILTITEISSLNMFTSLKLIRFLYYYVQNKDIHLLNIWISDIKNFKYLKILLFFSGFFVTRKFNKKIIYYSNYKYINNNIKNLNVNQSLLR